MALPQNMKAFQSAHTLNAHGTAIASQSIDVTSLLNTAAAGSSVTRPVPGPRPAFMLRSADKSNWGPDHLVFIFNQLVNYEGSYRI